MGQFPMQSSFSRLCHETEEGHRRNCFRSCVGEEFEVFVVHFEVHQLVGVYIDV